MGGSYFAGQAAPVDIDLAIKQQFPDIRLALGRGLQ